MVFRKLPSALLAWEVLTQMLAFLNIFISFLLGIKCDSEEEKNTPVLKKIIILFKKDSFI